MKTAAQRKQEERARLRKSGLVPLEVWVPKDKTEEVKEYVKELRRYAPSVKDLAEKLG